MPKAKTARVVQSGNPEVIAQFEKAMTELEQIVTQLEQGEQTLEQSLKDYERGMTLARQCQQALQQAEKRIDQLADSDSADNDATGEGSNEEKADPAAGKLI